MEMYLCSAHSRMETYLNFPINPAITSRNKEVFFTQELLKREGLPTGKLL